MRRATPRSERVEGRGSRAGLATTERAGRHAVAGSSLAVLAVLLLGCTPTSAPAVDSSAPPAPSASAATTQTSTSTPAATLVPTGTAADNLPYFRSVVQTVWGSADNVRGLAYIDALTAAGFDRSSMQVTSDTTTIGQSAESIQFSVAWRDGCLVGQVGPATGDPVTTVLPLLADRRCLIGQTATVGG